VIVEVDDASAVPPFEQVRVQVAAAIRSGSLAPGTALPTVRQLAADLSLAPGTIARAYKELEQEGLVRASGRRGTTVADITQLDDAARAAALSDAAARYAAEVRGLGLDLDAAVAALRAAT
jgi:DNA-binding transcriptional regulator YhcF (GntR family)